MTPPSRGSQTSEAQIEIFWSPLTSSSTGGSAIQTYNLQWDAGTNGVQWFDLQGDDGFFSLSTTYIQVGVTAGASYQFKVRAYNFLGWGLFSNPTTISAATQPDSPAPPVVTLFNVLVQISWDIPYDNSA